MPCDADHAGETMPTNVTAPASAAAITETCQFIIFDLQEYALALVFSRPSSLLSRQLPFDGADSVHAAAGLGKLWRPTAAI